MIKKFWRWLTQADKREQEWREREAREERWAKWCADTDRLARENRAAAWRELASLERQGILSPTVKYRTLEWLNGDR